MIDINEVLTLAINVNKIGRKKDKKHEYPEYYEGYSERAVMLDRIRIHSQPGGFPAKLFKERAPRQSQEEFDYFKDNYKQTTLPVYLDFQSTVSRVFHDTNWNVDFSGDEKFQEYCETGIPVYGSWENFMKGVMPHLKLTDANGVIAVKPYAVETEKQQLEDGSIEEVITSGQEIRPVMVYYSTKQIVAEEYDSWYLIELKEKSEVTKGSRKVKEGMIYEFYDDTQIIRIEQVGEYSDYKFQARLYFEHNWERVPCFKLKGVPNICEDHISFTSQFMYAVDLLDLCTINQAVLQAVINRIGYPHTVMIGVPCEFEQKFDSGQIRSCDHGYIMGDDNIRHVCPSCRGVGLRSKLSPLGALLLNPENSTDKGDTSFTRPALEFPTPPSEPFRYLMEKIEWDEKKARNILHLKTTASKASGQPETATSELLDNRAMSAFMKPISDQLFGIGESILNAIGWMRYGDAYKRPTVSYPVTFDFYTEADYLLQIGEAKKAGMPPMVISTIIYTYLQSLYYNDRMTAMVFNLISQTDRIMILSNDEIEIGISKGTIDKWEKVLHDSAINFVDQLLLENEKFFEQDFAKQKEQLIELAKATYDAISKSAIISQSASNAARVAAIAANA